MSLFWFFFSTEAVGAIRQGSRRGRSTAGKRKSPPFPLVRHSVGIITLNMHAGPERSKTAGLPFHLVERVETFEERFKPLHKPPVRLQPGRVDGAALPRTYSSPLQQCEFPLSAVGKCSERSHGGPARALLGSRCIRETCTPLWPCLGQQGLLRDGEPEIW